MSAVESSDVIYLCVFQPISGGPRSYSTAFPGSLLHSRIENENPLRPLNYVNIIAMPTVVRDDTPHVCGSALEYSPTGTRPWYSVSFHNRLIDAFCEFAQLGLGKDDDRNHYRIVAAEDDD